MADVQKLSGIVQGLATMLTDDSSFIRIESYVDNDGVSGRINLYHGSPEGMPAIDKVVPFTPEDPASPLKLSLDDIEDLWHLCMRDPACVLHVELRPIAIITIENAYILHGLKLEITSPYLTPIAACEWLLDPYFDLSGQYHELLINIIVVKSNSILAKGVVPTIPIKTTTSSPKVEVAKIAEKGIEDAQDTIKKMMQALTERNMTTESFTEASSTPAKPLSESLDKESVIKELKSIADSEMANSALEAKLVKPITNSQLIEKATDDAVQDLKLFEPVVDRSKFKPTNLSQNDPIVHRINLVTTPTDIKSTTSTEEEAELIYN